MKNQNKHISTILSPREIEIVRLVARGHTGREIAEELFISHDTVKNHFRNIREKTGQKTIAGVVCFAMQNGLELFI